MNRVAFSSNVYVQSSGPCIVCDSDAQCSSQEYSTVHPSCLSRITSSGDNSSSPSRNPPDGVQLWRCSNCDQLQSPASFFADNFSSPTCHGCVDDQVAQLDHDFGLLGQDASAYAGSTTSFPNSEFWTCTSCQQTKALQQFSHGVQKVEGAICDTCLSNQQGFPPYDHDSFPTTSYNPNTQPHFNPTNNPQTLLPFEAQNPPTHHQHQKPPTTSPSPDPTRPKRKQTTRRHKKTSTTPKPTNEQDPITSEPVIQWVPRRDPLPPNVCSRCRCRYARPGKKQCQHCAYDYRGTRDHRASQGLCITCAEPLDRDLDYVGQQVGFENAGDGGVPGGSEMRPRRSCYACREKNRLKKAAEKAAKSGGVGAVMGSSTQGFGEGDGSGGLDGVGGGERYVYRSWVGQG